jgi:lipopolysaccharide assembly outer membrane protein LptD (OstA)
VYLIRQVQAIRQKNAAQLTADRLTWHIDSQAVEAEGNITYRQQNPTATLSGKRAAGNLEQQTMVISGGDVVTEITPE